MNTQQRKRRATATRPVGGSSLTPQERERLERLIRPLVQQMQQIQQLCLAHVAGFLHGVGKPDTVVNVDLLTGTISVGSDIAPSNGNSPVEQLAPSVEDSPNVGRMMANEDA